jgi:archaeosine-15-forming tRNA-guanine transglycosylase
MILGFAMENLLVEKPSQRLLRRLRAIADYQFFLGAGEALIPDDSKVLISRNTGRVRAIVGEGGIIATIRASDYRLLLRFIGGAALHRVSRFPTMRVVVVDEVADEIRRGGNLFARHVLYIDEDLRPWDEVLIVDESDKLCGVGRLLLSPREILYFTKGVAAITREGEWWRGKEEE